MTEAAASTEDKQQRILDLIYLNMAEMLQPLARSKYGDSSDASVRQVLADRYLEPGVKSGVEELMRLMKKEAIANPAFGDCQRDAICRLYDLIQQSFIDFVAEKVSQYRYLPVGEVPQIAMVLSEMFREAGDANGNRRNQQPEEQEPKAE